MARPKKATTKTQSGKAGVPEEEVEDVEQQTMAALSPDGPEAVAAQQPTESAPFAAAEPLAAADSQTDAAPGELGLGADSIPEFIRDAARAAPGQWVGLVDPTWQGEGPPPAWAVVGEWLGDEAGEPVEFRANEQYRPSPLAHEWPNPTDAIDAAVQLSATGYCPPEDCNRALLAGPLAFALDEAGAVDIVEMPEGDLTVLAFSSDAQVTAAGDPPYAVIALAEVLERLQPGCGILLNLGAPVGMRLDLDELRSALATEEPAT